MRHGASPIGRMKKPTVGRCLVCLSIALVSARASAQDAPGETAPTETALTEEGAVRRALARAPLTAALRGAVEQERGAARTAGAYPNPQIVYLREQTFGALGTGEDYVSVAQVIDLGNRRGLRAEAGEHRAVAAGHEGVAARVEVASEARSRFYEVLYREARAGALRAWTDRLDATVAVVERRAARGEAALYDRRRLERERALADSRVEVEEATLARARVRLAALVGAPSPELAITGTLLPDEVPLALPTLRANARRAPRLLAADERLRAANLDRSAASRWWVPELRLEAGWKGVDMSGQGRTDGFLIGATLTIPLWDQSAGLSQSARGEAQVVEGRRALLDAEIAGEAAGLHAEATRLLNAARRFRDRAQSTSGDLVRIATAGYQGGELTVLELLDAYRGAGEDALTALDLAHAARRARIDLDRVTATEAP